MLIYRLLRVVGESGGWAGEGCEGGGTVVFMHILSVYFEHMYLICKEYIILAINEMNSTMCKFLYLNLFNSG